MIPYRSLLGLGALALLVVAAEPADAAWNNVFQVTCHRRPRTANYVAASVVVGSAPACCNAPPPPVCTTQYQQRCYYQPVTTYQSKTYYEPVTTYRTSYYYEPVTSYRYSCYYDSCSCSYQQVAQPVTSYQLRSKCCPVQSWVQRCCSVPVTVMQKSCCWEPQTTCSSCCTATTPMQQMQPVPMQQMQPVPMQQMQPVQPGVPGPANPPQVNEAYKFSPGSTLQPPVVNEQRYFNPQQPQYNRTYPTEPPLGNPGTSFKQPAPAYTPPPTVKLDRITFATDGAVQGQVVQNNNAPQAGAQVIFVHALQQGKLQTVTANTAGRFQMTLAPGGYLVYVNDQRGQPVFHSRIEVDGQQPTVMKLVSR